MTHYCRCGVVRITQEYYQIHMSATTNNIEYNTKEEDWREAEYSQQTNWKPGYGKNTKRRPQYSFRQESKIIQNKTSLSY